MDVFFGSWQGGGMKLLAVLVTGFLGFGSLGFSVVRVDAEAMERGRVVAEGFPRFEVPGEEVDMEAMRHLFHLHHQPSLGMGTIWDEWIPQSVIWAARDDAEWEKTRAHFRRLLLGRRIAADGYVATHQHRSIAHQEGWPFPFWRQGGEGSWGWHFVLNLSPRWHATEERDQTGWELAGAEDGGIGEEGWRVELREAGATAETPELRIAPYESPFLQLRWKSRGLGGAAPFVEWRRAGQEDYPAEQRMYFAAGEEGEMVYEMLPVFRHPLWSGEVERLRVNFGNAGEGEAVLQALFTQFDTRHNVNNANFIKGSADFFEWTGDVGFLRENIQRMRLALRYAMTELGGWEEKMIVTPWVGHEGRPGFTVNPDGTKTMHFGSGVGNNYWDLVPFGGRDAYATIHYYDALRRMADLEETIGRNPGWNIPGGPLRMEPEVLREHAAEVKARAGEFFWNGETGRFISNVDLDGNRYDYGFTFVNLEAIHYGFATEEQAEAILAWVSGERMVEGDTSTGEDIYRWRFGPRSTTRRNVEYYGWYWLGPESIPWGGQVQDGGAVLGFSYFDLSARLKTRGADDAWRRLAAILEWFREVRELGGYREYYADGKRGTTLQGGGTAGGLGLDVEFVESVLLPQTMLYGFAGFRPLGDGFALEPELPADWPSLRISGIRFRELVLEVEIAGEVIGISSRGEMREPLTLRLPEGEWQVRYLDSPLDSAGEAVVARGTVPVRLGEGRGMRLERR